MMPQPAMKTLDKAAFDAWLAAYPRKLVRNVSGIYEPPLVSWNDFERAPYWPDSVVASTSDGSGVYHVIEDLNAPVVSSIKPDLEPLHDKDGVEVHEGDRIRMWWGSSQSEEGAWTDHFREHTVTKRDRGTTYEAWCPHDCANNLRSMNFRKLSTA